MLVSDRVTRVKHYTNNISQTGKSQFTFVTYCLALLFKESVSYKGIGSFLVSLSVFSLSNRLIMRKDQTKLPLCPILTTETLTKKVNGNGYEIA